MGVWVCVCHTESKIPYDSPNKKRYIRPTLTNAFYHCFPYGGPSKTCVYRVLKTCKVPCLLPLFQLQCVAVCYSVLQCVAVCCSVLQCVAVCRETLKRPSLVGHCACNVYVQPLLHLRVAHRHTFSLAGHCESNVYV